MSRSTVRAVVVNWNGAHLLRACLDSLLAQDLPPGMLEILVVDNASTDQSTELLAEHYPDVVVRVTSTNLGFAGGVNVGLADLTATYAVLLNNDATFEPDAIKHLVEHLDDPVNHQVGAATAKILLTEPDAEGRILVNSTGNVLTRSAAAADRDWLTAADAERSPTEVFGFCGGAAALRGSTLAEVGLFDGSLFLYYEDTDLSWRMRAAGWDIHYVSGAVAHHQHAASSDAASPLFRFYNTRNSLLVFGRHAPLQVVVMSFARQCAALLRYALTRGEQPSLLRARRQALVAVVRAVPQTVRVRRDVWRDDPSRRPSVYRSGLG